MIIDPWKDMVRFVGDFDGEAKWAGAALGIDGRIYAAPFNATSALVIEPYGQRYAKWAKYSHFNKL